MTADSYRVLCEPILTKLKTIEDIVVAETNNSIFDLKEDARTKERFDELIRISRSLEQYMARSGGIAYIGFLGHFSAGKSCTINSLIEEKRPTGQNPTDTAITLIAHESNSSNIIATHGHGELAIGRVFFNKPILKNIVIVDTPGSGDPSIIEEMVRDFLPVCDRLIYTFSAASPLDNSDLPVLKKARSELPFIPITIVVTRADEFLLDRSKPLSVENFDQEGANEFKSVLSARLLKDVGNLAVSPEDILLIDNHTNFNINKLSKVVVPNDNIDANAVIELHSHKISYYDKSTTRLKDFFVNHIDSKLEALQLFLSSAKDNHDVYQNKETMANSKLTEYWRVSREDLDREMDNQTNWIANISTEIRLMPELMEVLLMAI